MWVRASQMSHSTLRPAASWSMVRWQIGRGEQHIHLSQNRGFSPKWAGEFQIRFIIPQYWGFGVISRDNDTHVQQTTTQIQTTKDRQTDWKPHKTQMSNETLWCLVVNFSMFIFLSMRCAFKQCCSVSDQCDEISPLWRINLGIPGNYQLDYNKREFSRKVAFHQLRHFLFLYKIKNSGYLYWSLWSKPGHSPLLGRGPSFLGCFRFQTWTIMIIALGHSPFSRCQPPPLFWSA